MSRRQFLQLQQFTKILGQFESPLDACDEFLAADRLFDEIQCARFHGLNRHGHVGVAGDHDRRQAMTVMVELLKQFEPAHSRQIGVDQQACGLVGMKGVKKRLAACIGVDDAAVVFEHGAYRLTSLVVIIDDDDPGSARSAQGVRRVKRRYGEWLGRLGQELLDCARQLAQFDGLVEMNTVVKGDIAQGLGGNIASENDTGICRSSSCLNF